jgi:hypothetical protein
VGEGFVWSPAMLQVFRKVRFNNRTTFDSSRTPRIGEKQLTPSAFADVDLTAVSTEIRALTRKAEEEDPRRLRARIAELEAELRTTGTPGKVQPIDASGLGSIEAHAAAIISAIRALQRPSRAAEPPMVARAEEIAPEAPQTAEKPIQSGLRAGQRRMLQTLTRCGGELTKQQLATLADINRASGTFSDYLRGLVQAGFVATSEIVNWYSVKLRAGERRMLKILVGEYPTRDFEAGARRARGRESIERHV